MSKSVVVLWEGVPLSAGEGRFLGFGPMGWAFVLSLVLSAVAIAGTITPNNDGMLYLEIAKAYQQSGLEAAREMFDWIFLPLLIAMLSSLTGVSVETAGFLISALLLAGACSMLVGCMQIHAPGSGWAACAVVLAMPGLNNYRDYIIREFGAWFLLALAFWMLLRWARDPAWRTALAAQVLICMAAVFRVEMLVFLSVPVLWQLWGLRNAGGGRRLMMVSVLPLLGVLVFALLWWLGVANIDGRVAHQLATVDPGRRLGQFSQAAERIAEVVLNKYSADDAGQILFFGMLSILPAKFLSNLGVFVVPAALACTPKMRQQWWTAPGLFGWAFIIYALVLLIFLYEQFFLTSRYVVLLNVLALPVVILGVRRLWRCAPKWRWALVVVAVLAALANVISTSPPKTRYVDAARWLGGQTYVQAEIYFEEQGVAYLAGMNPVLASTGAIPERADLADAIAEGRFRLLLLRGTQGDDEVETWAASQGLRLVERFSDGSRRTVLVFVPGEGAPAEGGGASRP